MNNQKVAEVQSDRHIPSDLYPALLSRLPVKSLMRFRCVARSWLALVDDADFSRLHLNHFKSKTDGTHLLVAHNNYLNCVVRRSGAFEARIIGTIPALGSAHHWDREWEISCSVDGLMLVQSFWGLRRSSDLKVWNPSIRKCLQLPSFPENLDSSLFYSVIGLGYDTLAKDYKIALLVFVGATTYSLGTPTALTYTLGANSWKTVEFQVKGGSTFCGAPLPHNSLLYFQGCLYYVSCQNKLAVFDLSSEVFSTIGSPEFQFYASLALVDGGRTLAMYGPDPGENCIWVLQTESMSWTKRYTFQLNGFQILYLYSNCDILVLRRRSKKIAPKNGRKKKERIWDQAAVYNPVTDEYKYLNEKRSSSSYHWGKPLYGYVESLILHK